MAMILCTFEQWFAAQPRAFRRHYLVKPKRLAELKRTMLARNEVTAHPTQSTA